MENDPERAARESLWEMDALFRRRDEEIALNGAIFDVTERALKRIIASHYPSLPNWDGDLLRGADDAVSPVALSFVNKISGLYDEHEQRAGGSEPAAETTGSTS